MLTEMERCESEIQPLLTAFLASKSSTSSDQDVNQDDGARIPCEICGLLVKVSTFQEHVQRHGGSSFFYLFFFLPFFVYFIYSLFIYFLHEMYNFHVFYITLLFIIYLFNF